jgi:PKD repeat protein
LLRKIINQLNKLKTKHMKTTITHLQKLSKGFLIAAFVIIGLKANAQCMASFTSSTNPANNGEVTFTNTSTPIGSSIFTWYFGDGDYSYATSPMHTYASSGTYTVFLEMHDSLSTFCNDTAYSVISVVNSTGGCNAYFQSYDSAGYTYFWNQSTGSNLTSTWTFGDGTAGTSTGDIVHLYSGTGVFYVCLTVTDSSGSCSDTFCDSVIRGSGSTGMCLGSVNSSFTYMDSAGTAYFENIPTGTGPVYFWDFGDGTASSDVGNTTHYYGSPGTYMVCLTVYETGGTYDSCQYCSYVTIGSGSGGPCDASFVIIQDSTNLFNYYVYNNSTSTSGSTTYFWDFGDGASSTLQYPSHTYPGSGPYYLCLTVTESSPMLTCTATFCDSLAAGHASVPITITVVDPLATGISESIVATTLENYPNPFNGSTTINYSIAKDAAVELSVTDLLGKKIATIENSNKIEGSYSVNWNAENVAEGMYLLKMKVNNQVSTKKIIMNK